MKEIKFIADIKEWEINNPVYKDLQNVSKMYAEHFDKYILLHLKPKSKRMKQETYDKLIAKLINITMFQK